MMFKNIIWDFDGTLFNTYPVMVKSLKKSLSSNGVRVKHKDALHYLKQSFSTSISYYSNKHNLDKQQLIDKYMEYKDKEKKRVYRPYKGIKSLCKEIVGVKKTTKEKNNKRRKMIGNKETVGKYRNRFRDC